MDIVESLDIIGLKDGIKKCFTSVFSELNVATEVWFQKSKLLTLGRDNYADYMANKVGVFPLFATSRNASIDTMYVRVGISSDIERERYRSIAQIEALIKRQRTGKVTEVRNTSAITPLQAIESTENGFALMGNPGSGKTTAFRYLAVYAAQGKQIRQKKRIPIYLAARDLTIKAQGVIEAATELFRWLDINEAEKVIHSLLKSGNCILLLDGVDETNKEHQTKLLAEMFEIHAKYPECLLCISARPFNLSIGLPGFTKWETLPLPIEERFSFIEKWFNSVDPAKGIRLLKKCKNRPEVLDLGSNPLLLSIVCALFNNDLDIPSEPDELYARAVEGMLGGWDAFRNVARQSILFELSLKKRIVLVSWIAAALFQDGKIVFSPGDVDATKCLPQAAEVMRAQVLEAEPLLASLYNDFGLIVERSPRLYSFSHLTIHEFLVAQFIVDNRREIDLLTSYRTNSDWAEVIRLVAKLLPNADSFVSHLQEGCKLENLDEVQLLESVWMLKPLCSPQVRKRLMSHLAVRVAGAAKKLYASYEVSGQTLQLRTRSVGRFKSIEKQINQVGGSDESKKGNPQKKPTTFQESQDELNNEDSFVADEECVVSEPNDNEVTLSDHEEHEASGHKKDAPIKSKLKRITKDKLMFSPWFIIGNSLPNLLRILRSSGYTFEELGVDKSPLFIKLGAADTMEINSVQFVDIPNDSTIDKNKIKSRDDRR